MGRDCLNLDQLATLIALIENGSFSAAAAELGLAQSTVSQHLKRLEKVLGTTLIRRDQRGCRPTEAALRLLPYARSLLRLDDRAVESVQHCRSRLGACSNIGVYLLPDLLRHYQTSGGIAPNVAIASNPDIVAQLVRTEVDMALLEWWDGRAGFQWQPWLTEDLVVIVPPNHPLSRRPSISRAELATLPLIGGEQGTGTGRLLRACFSGQKMPDVVMQLGSTEAVKRAVEAELGVSIVLSCTASKEVQEGRLCALQIEGEPLQKSLQLVWRDDMPASEPFLAYLAGTIDLPGRNTARA